MNSERRHQIVVALLIVLAFGLRLGYVLANPQPVIRNDAQHYNDIASNLAEGHGFSMSDARLLEADRRPDGSPAPTARRPPLYPVLLSLVYRVAGQNHLAVLIVQALLGTLACYLVFALALAAFSNRTAAVIALALTAVYPPFVKYCAYLITETVFLLLTISALLTAHNAVANGRKPTSILSGALGGLAALCRPTALFFLPLQGILLLVGGKGSGRGRNWLVHMSAYGIAFSLVLSPWLVRNYLVFDTFMPSFTSAGYNLFLGTYPASRGLANIDPELFPEGLNRELIGKGEVQADAIYRRAAFKNVVDHPLEYVKLVAMKTIRGWFVIKPGHAWSPTPLSVAVHGTLLVLALAGAITQRKKRAFAVFLLVAAAVAFTGFHALVVSNLRYNLPAVPFAIILASAAVAGLFFKVRWGGSWELISPNRRGSE